MVERGAGGRHPSDPEDEGLLPLCSFPSALLSVAPLPRRSAVPSAGLPGAAPIETCSKSALSEQQPGDTCSSSVAVTVT